MVVRSTAWVKTAGTGLEFVDLEIDEGRMTAAGVAIGSDPLPYRLDYSFATRSRFISKRIEVETHGQGWSRALRLRRDRAGEWDARWETHGEALLPPPTGEMNALREALDCDLALSPVTNTMPVLRHGLLRGGGPVDLVMAWISVPDLSVVPSRQRYTFVRTDELVSVVRYESESCDFTADIVFDEDGVVVEYPGIGHRLS